MKLIHITLRRNLKSIRKCGLLAELARGKRKAVWGCVSSLEAWACDHVMSKNPGTFLDDYVKITFNVPMSAVVRYSEGVYYVYSDVSPEQIERVQGYVVTMEEV